MSILELNDKSDDETNKGFYNTLKNYANKSANDKLQSDAKKTAGKDIEPEKDKKPKK